MTKYKNAAHNFVTMVSQGFLFYWGAKSLLEGLENFTNRGEYWVVAFGTIWIGINFGLWFYKMIVHPAAVAIYKANQ